MILQGGSAVLAERVEDTYGWTNTLQTDSYVYPTTVNTDTSNNVISVGYYSGTTDFDPTAGTDNVTCPDSTCMYITKNNNDGTYGWTKIISNPNFIEPTSVASNSSNDILVAGQFYETSDFDPGTGTDIRTVTSGTTSSSDLFVLKLDSSGVFGWARTTGGASSTSGVLPQDIKLDSSNNIYITGHYYLTIDFDPSAGTDSKTSLGASDVFISKYDSSGSYSYTQTIGGGGASNYEHAWDMVIDGSDSVFVAGQFQGTVDFDPTAGTDSRVSSGSWDSFVVKINSNGSYNTTYVLGGTGADSALSIEADGSENIYYVGNIGIGTTVDIDPTAGTNNVAAGGSGATTYMNKLNTDGTYDWGYIWNFGPSQNMDLASDGSRINLVSSFNLSVDFNPQVGVDTLSPVGSRDSFVVRINYDGSYNKVERIGGAGANVSAYRLASDSEGSIYYVGEYTGTADFDPSASLDGIASTGFGDGFLSKLPVSYYQHIDNLAGGLSAITLLDSASVDDEGVDPGVPKGNTEATRLLKTTLPLADAEVDYSTDRDWSSVIGDTDIAEGKAFVHNLRSAEGVVSDYTLYVPKLSGYSQVGFCPGATSFAELTTGCVGFAAKTEADPDVSVVNVDGQDYWAISGVSGSGGFHFNNSSTNNGQQTGAESDADGLAASGQNQVLIMILALSTILLAMGGVFWANRHKLCN